MAVGVIGAPYSRWAPGPAESGGPLRLGGDDGCGDGPLRDYGKVLSRGCSKRLRRKCRSAHDWCLVVGIRGPGRPPLLIMATIPPHGACPLVGVLSFFMYIPRRFRYWLP